MIWLLAALMQLCPLVVESIQPNDRGALVTLRNNSEKTITGFSFSLTPNSSERIDLRNIEGIAPGKTYTLQRTSEKPMEITGIVFADGSYEGEQAKQILARREGIRRADEQTARQIRTFLEFNTVIDDAAVAVLDRELEESSPVPSWLTDKEKAAWNEGYLTTRETTRQRIKEVPEEHRLRQLRVLEFLAGGHR